MKSSRKKIRLLMVEDDDDHAELVSMSLQGRGQSSFSIVRARSASEGLEKGADHEFDAVLLDLGLPDSNPEETLRSYTERYSALPIVVLTSSATREMIREAVAWGAQDLIEKSEFRGGLISRSIRYAAERKRTLLELEHKNDELKRFAQTVAHELKSPLQSIVTALGYAKETTSEHVPDSLKKILNLGFDSSKHLSTLVNDLLAFAESETEEKRHGTVDIDAVTRCVIAEFQGTDDATIRIVGELPTVEGEESRIRQVMRNLIGNAVKYRDTRPLEVEIEGKCIDGMCKITVKDNGLGIAPEHVGRVFDTFFRVYSREEIPGTGIGLGFSKEVIERGGGKMGVESELGEGSTFWFTLPHIEKDCD